LNPSLTGCAVEVQDIPSLTSCVTALKDDVLELDGEHVEESREDDIGHLPLTRKGEDSDVKGDMVIEGVLLWCQQDEVMPMSVVARERVEGNGDQGPNVLDTVGLGMEVGEDEGFVHVSELGGLSVQVVISGGEDMAHQEDRKLLLSGDEVAL
jgi:hypothetical protein